MNLLNKIQQELKAPKNQFNAFGKYNYRSCEDILEAVKPLLGTGTLTLTDEVVNIGQYNYVKATAILKDSDNEWSTNAYAREEEDKKGMDASQMTGTASSYARKYALNGLFSIDDTKDADTMDNSSKGQNKPLNDKNTTLGVCNNCNTPLKLSKTGKTYCPSCVVKYYAQSTLNS